jgi:hypothetical protein
LRSARQNGRLVLPRYCADDPAVGDLVAKGYLAPMRHHDLGGDLLVYVLTAVAREVSDA